MEKQVLSENQMKELLDIGMSGIYLHEHSRMMYVYYQNPHPVYKNDNPILKRLVPASGLYYGIDDLDYVPTLTTLDLIEIIPESITWVNPNDSSNWIGFSFDIKKNNGNYIVSYINENEIIYKEEDKDLISLLFNVFKWLFNKGYLNHISKNNDLEEKNIVDKNIDEIFDF